MATSPYAPRTTNTTSSRAEQILAEDHDEFDDFPEETGKATSYVPEPQVRSTQPTINSVDEGNFKPKGWKAQLTQTQKLTGFGIFLGLAILCFLIAYFFFGHFKLMYPVFFFIWGELFFIISTFFLVGPITQLKHMFQPQRLISSVIFFVCLGLSILLITIKPKPLFILPLIIIQFIALIWYASSYTPRCQQFTKKACGACCGAIFNKSREAINEGGEVKV
eukprot:TRINITY_DN12789_c0_g1_i1.p1 TRINITY_DN12789_c0_g1~~TRINITY_DN12789_c0_g1_i1.p1  ORF type:complete len:221 (-),score=35.93 TRINITY_DN12789_c0_g1_i1:102-764(-)